MDIIVDTTYRGLDDLNQLTLGDLHNQGLPGRPTWEVQAGNPAVDVVNDPVSGAPDHAIYLPGGASPTLTQFELDDPLKPRRLIWDIELYLDSTKTGPSGAQINLGIPGGAGGAWVEFWAAVKTDGVRFDISSSNYNVLLSPAASYTDRWLPVKIEIDPVLEKMTFIIDKQTVQDIGTGADLVGVDADWVVRSLAAPTAYQNITFEIDSATTAGEDGYIRRLMVRYGDDYLTTECEEPFTLARLKTFDPAEEVELERKYSNVSRLMLGLTDQRDEKAIYDARLASAGVVTDRLPLFSGDLAPTRAQLVLKNPPAQSQGPIGTAGTDSSDQGIDPGIDERALQSYFRGAKLLLGYPWAEHDPDNPANDDYHLVFDGVKVQSGPLQNGALSISLLDPIAQVVGESDVIFNVLSSANLGFTIVDEAQDAVAPIIYGTLTKTTGVARGRIPLIPLDALTVTNPRLVVAGHALLTAGSVDDGVKAVYRLRAGVYDLTLSHPSQWTASTLVAPAGYTYTFITLATGVAAAGDQFFADVQGYEDPAAAGTLLENPAKVLKHFLENHTELSTYGVELDDDAFDEVEAIQNARLHKAAYFMDSRRAVAGEFKNICASVQMRPFSKNDQATKIRKLAISVFDIDMQEQLNAPEYDSKLNAADVSIVESTSWWANRLNASWKFDFARDKYETSQVFEDTDAQAQINDRVVARDFQLSWVQDDFTANDVLRRMLAEFAYPTAVVTARLPLEAIYRELSDLVKFTHREALSSTGEYKKQLFEILSRSPDLDDFSRGVQVTMRDLRDLQAARLLGDDNPESHTPDDPDALLIRVFLGVATATLSNVTTQVTFTAPITYRNGDIIDFGSFDHSSWTPGTIAYDGSGNQIGNFFKAFITEDGTADHLGEEVTSSQARLASALNPLVAKVPPLNQSGVDFFVSTTYENATQLQQTLYWFLAAADGKFAFGDPGFKLF